MDNVTVLPHAAPVGTPPDRALGFMMDNIKRMQESKPLLAVSAGTILHSSLKQISRQPLASALVQPSVCILTDRS